MRREQALVSAHSPADRMPLLSPRVLDDEG